MSDTSHFFATKLGMTQAWTKEGKRLAITRLRIADNVVVGVQHPSKHNNQNTILEIGVGEKKLKNVPKSLRSRLEKSGVTKGFTAVKGIAYVGEVESLPQAGNSMSFDTVFQVGDVVQVQGTTKGRGFAGAVKRYGFAGGPKTHGQSDRERAVGSIGAGTTPGRVWKGKRMPGHYGAETKTVSGLAIVHIDKENSEVWVTGPVPGSVFSALRLSKTGMTKNIELHKKASGIAEVVVENTDEKEVEA